MNKTNTISLNILLLVSVLCIWSFMSAFSFNGIVMASVCFAFEVFAVLLQRGIIGLKKVYIVFFLPILIFFFYANSLAKYVLAFNFVYVILSFAFILTDCYAEKLDYKAILKCLLSFSLFSIIFVVFEHLFKGPMARVLSALLSGEYKAAALNTLIKGEEYAALAAGCNIVAFSCAILILYALFIYNNSVIKKVMLVVISLYVIAIIGQRSNFITIPFCVSLTFYFQQRSGKIKRALQIILILLSVLLLFAFLSPFLSRFSTVSYVFSSLDRFSNGVDIMSGRNYSYERAISLWKESPIIGHGWYYFYINNAGIIRRGVNSHVHNLALELLCDCGILGAIVVFTPIIYMIGKNVRVLMDKTRTENKSLYQFTLGIQLFFLADSFLHVTFYNIGMIIIYYVVLLIFNIYYGRNRI